MTSVYILNMNLMLSARTARDAEALAGVQRVGALTNVISDAAGDIAGLVLRRHKDTPRGQGGLREDGGEP